MALSEGSILEYRHFQTWAGQQVLNVQHYIVLYMELVGDDLKWYAEPLYNLWANTLAPVQSTGLVHNRGEIYEVNGLDFGVYAPAVPVAGTQAGSALPTFTAVKVQLVRERRTTRHGWKRFGGLTEPQINGQNLEPAAYNAYVDAMEVLYPTNITLENTEFPGTRSITIEPIIWGGNDPDYPLGRYSPISSVVVSPLPTHQNTRKVGRGS